MNEHNEQPHRKRCGILADETIKVNERQVPLIGENPYEKIWNVPKNFFCI